MRDLFDIFPDLPKPGRKPTADRVEEVRDKAEEVHRRMALGVEARRLHAARTRKAWQEKLRENA